MAPSTQKAFILDGNFSLGTVPGPIQGPGEIQVKIKSVAQPIVDYLSALNDLLGGTIVPGQLENDFGGFQQ